VDPRDSQDDVENRKFLILPELELRTSVVQPVASCYTDYAILAVHTHYMRNKFVYLYYDMFYIISFSPKRDLWDVNKLNSTVLYSTQKKGPLK
jgi:hypothetical protein